MEKGFTITYEYGDNLYVNPTNRGTTRVPAAASTPITCG